MKKIYQKPLSSVVELEASTMLAASLKVGVTENEVDAADSYSNKMQQPPAAPGVASFGTKWNKSAVHTLRPLLLNEECALCEGSLQNVRSAASGGQASGLRSGANTYLF